MLGVGDELRQALSETGAGDKGATQRSSRRRGGRGGVGQELERKREKKERREEKKIHGLGAVGR